MGCGILTALLVLASVVLFAESILLDIGKTKELEGVINDDNFIVSMRHIKPRKRSRGLEETLFAVDFPESSNKFALLLDRKVKKVIVETLEDGKKRSQHFIVDPLDEDTTIKSLILEVNQTLPGAHATLYLDCTSYGMVALPKTLKQMHHTHDHRKLELYHERRYQIEIDGHHRDLRMVLNRYGCPLELHTNETKYYDNYVNDDFNNNLNDDPNIQAQQPDYGDYGYRRSSSNGDPYRGDIPLVSKLEDSGILEALNALIIRVNFEVKRCEATTQAIENLQRVIEQCELCKIQNIQRPTCESHPPNCFPGVRCYESEQGPKCGPCPRGYIGNGYQCTPGHTCAENPCFSSVICTDTPSGAQCGECPRGYVGDGFRCIPGYKCSDNPCFSNVICTDTPTGAKCGQCPRGYIGDGFQCIPGKSCADRPCFGNVICTDTPRGAQCGRCPHGYEGDGFTCTRVNPCELNPCAPGCAPIWDPHH